VGRNVARSASPVEPCANAERPFGSQFTPRDLDVVISGATGDEIERALSTSRFLKASSIRRTRFGGIKVSSAQFELDVWALEDTWALKQVSLLPPTFALLPTTTFLNVEAVAVCFTRRPFVVYSYNFFEAMADRQVDVNFEENPFPALCAARSLAITRKLRFDLGPRLRKYLLQSSSSISRSEFINAQVSHYGEVVCSFDTFSAIVDRIRFIEAQRMEASALPFAN
jgi:hypothetical protein